MRNDEKVILYHAMYQGKMKDPNGNTPMITSYLLYFLVIVALLDGRGGFLDSTLITFCFFFFSEIKLATFITF